MQSYPTSTNATQMEVVKNLRGIALTALTRISVLKQFLARFARLTRRIALSEIEYYLSFFEEKITMQKPHAGADLTALAFSIFHKK
jgi:hypothetical protein